MSFFKGGKFFGKKYHLIQMKYLQKEMFPYIFVEIFEKTENVKQKNYLGKNAHISKNS
jgi:hypothetical protein